MGLEPGKCVKPGLPAGNDNFLGGVPVGAPHQGAQSWAPVDGPGCREGELLAGSQGRVGGGGRSEMAPGTAQKKSRSHSPRFQGCRHWARCSCYPGQCPVGRCSSHH